jgi:type IV fimbrial biogenesis protein FimT
MFSAFGRVVAAGFTIVEFLVTLAVLSVLMTLASPSLVAMVESSQLRALNNDFLDHLRLTRSEAILRGKRVVICTASSASACSAAAGWQQGWLIFADSNNNGSREANELLIRYRPAAPGGWSMKGTSTIARYVSYDEMGLTRFTGGGFQAGTVTICRLGSLRSHPRQVVINSLGRVRSQDAADAVCV